MKNFKKTNNISKIGNRKIKRETEQLNDLQK